MTYQQNSSMRNILAAFAALAAGAIVALALIALFLALAPKSNRLAAYGCSEPKYLAALGPALFRKVPPKVIAITITNAAPRHSNRLLDALVRWSEIQRFSLVQTPETVALFCNASSIKFNGDSVSGLPRIKNALIVSHLATESTSLYFAICAGSEHLSFDLGETKIEALKENLRRRCNAFYRRK